jgi:hypothetical protein
MKRIILFALIGGVVGSLLGSLIMAVVAFMEGANKQEAVVGAIQALAYPIFTVALTVPACLAIGVPVIYCFRRQLVSHPFRWAILVTGAGACLGYLCLGWAFRGGHNSQELKLLLLFSSTSAFSYAFLYGSKSPRE